jgi:hypothetical protein
VLRGMQSHSLLSFHHILQQLKAAYDSKWPLRSMCGACLVYVHIQARKALMKAAASELGDLRSTLEGEAWSLEVLCAKILKRKTLYCCTADPQKPVRQRCSTTRAMRASVTPAAASAHPSTPYCMPVRCLSTTRRLAGFKEFLQQQAAHALQAF